MVFFFNHAGSRSFDLFDPGQIFKKTIDRNSPQRTPSVLSVNVKLGVSFVYKNPVCRACS